MTHETPDNHIYRLAWERSYDYAFTLGLGQSVNDVRAKREENTAKNFGPMGIEALATIEGLWAGYDAALKEHLR